MPNPPSPDFEILGVGIYGDAKSNVVDVEHKRIKLTYCSEGSAHKYPDQDDSDDSADLYQPEFSDFNDTDAEINTLTDLSVEVRDILSNSSYDLRNLSCLREDVGGAPRGEVNESVIDKPQNENNVVLDDNEERGNVKQALDSIVSAVDILSSPLPRLKMKGVPHIT